MTLYPVESPPGTWLAIAARPRGGDWLEDDLRAFAAGGVEVLVSLLSSDEERELGLRDEEALALPAGLRFVRIPVADFGVPDTGSALPILQLLASQARGGTAVAAHCRMGVGRSPLTVAALLVLLGVPEDEAGDASPRRAASRSRIRKPRDSGCERCATFSALLPLPVRSLMQPSQAWCIKCKRPLTDDYPRR